MPIHKEATEDLVLDFLHIVTSIPVWLDGGWGVDALLGEQTRLHSDLDIIIATENLIALEKLLSVCSYKRDATQEGLVFISETGLWLDVHSIRFDDRGYGLFELPDGRVWPFPPSAFNSKGIVGDKEVSCLSPEAQVQCHAQGYQATAKDIQDMEALQRKYQVVLPLALCRQRGTHKDA
jgi:lincosamide nucleotidyltransferase A/C/D/E